MRLVEMKSLSGAVLCVVASLPLFAGPQERFSRVGLDEIRLGGEFERRIMMAVTNNLLKAEIEHQFLDHFRATARSGDSVGTGKLIETAVRFGVYTGDPRVIALKDHVVTELLKAQSPDGYIGCLRKDSRLWGYWDLAETGFIFLGLAADHHYFGSERSLAAARRAADYMIDNWHTMPPGWEDAYISGVAAAVGFPWGLHALYKETGDVKYRDFAVKARHLDTWYRPVTLGRGFGIHGHSATHLHQCLVQSLYRASGVDTPRRATDETVRVMLDGNGTLINGTCGLWECWTDDQDGRLSVGETCSTGYQLWLWDALVREGGNPEARWGDAVERTIYNALFGAQSETGRQIRYYTPIEGKRTYYPSDTYCCPNNFRRIMSELPEFTFYKSESALYANLYTSCTLKTKLASGAVEITERTDYPTDEKIEFFVAPEKDGSEFDLVLRIPGWCESPSLAVNGEAVAAKRGTLAHLRRRWRKGDRVELTLPMRVRTIAGRRRQAGRVAFMRGPLVYALNPTLNGGGAKRAEMKSSGLTAEDQRLAKRREFFALDPADICATMLVDPASVRLVRDNTVRPNGTALKIRVATAGHATGVNDKNSTEITLTEFPDVGATATYFRVSDLSQAEEDGTFR